MIECNFMDTELDGAPGSILITAFPETSEMFFARGMFISADVREGAPDMWREWATVELNVIWGLGLPDRFYKLCDHWMAKVSAMAKGEDGQPVDMGYGIVETERGNLVCARRFCIVRPHTNPIRYVVRPRGLSIFSGEVMVSREIAEHCF